MDFHRKLENIIKDIQAIEDDAADLSRAEQMSKLEVDLLKQKVRELYDQVVILDRHYPYSGSESQKSKDTGGMQDSGNSGSPRDRKQRAGDSSDPAPGIAGKGAMKEQPGPSSPAEASQAHGFNQAAGKEEGSAREETPGKTPTRENPDEAAPVEEPSVQGTPGEATPKEETPAKDTTGKETAGGENGGNPDRGPEGGMRQDHSTPSHEHSPQQHHKPSGESNNKETEGPEVVADKFQNTRTFRHDDLARKQPQNNLSTRMQSRPIEDLAKAIGLNDKFRFIRELFDGDREKYHEAIQILNELPSYQEAEHYINQRFDWDQEKPEVQKFMELVRRKFSVYQ